MDAFSLKGQGLLSKVSQRNEMKMINCRTCGAYWDFENPGYVSYRESRYQNPNGLKSYGLPLVIGIKIEIASGSKYGRNSPLISLKGACVYPHTLSQQFLDL